MSIGPGSRIGPYEVSALIGEGGMGQVYRARDRTLNRDVALKILPDAVAVDPDRVARFKREAQMLASLNHQNIAGIYGLEESQAGRALVLELVDGPTLADRLARGGLPLGEALDIARQIAEAIEAAHEQGIIHRDLKPANIKVRSDGTVKVLDFGLAKALEPVGASSVFSHSPTITALELTQGGAIFGTASYMSPEQAKGLPADKRSDIWAFGCVLYEMLTGRRPFQGKTISEILAQILEREPALTALPASTPARITWLLRRCLEKDPKQRLHDIADARIEIDEAIREPVGSDAVPSAAPAYPSSRLRWRETVAWVAAAVCVAGLVGTLMINRPGAGNRGSTDARSFTAAITLPEGLTLGTSNPPGLFTLSPDGQRLALVGTDATGRTQLWVRPLDRLFAQPLAGTEDAQFPFWSPDSSAIAFVARGKLKRVDLSGGPPIGLADAALAATGAWNKDNVILFTPTGGAPIHRVSALGGTSVAVTTLDREAGDVQHWYPFFLPDGKHFLYFAVGSKTSGATDARAVLVGSLDSTGPGKVLLQGGSNAKYANGHLLFSRSGTLVAQPFDVDRLDVRGQPTPLVEQVQIAGFGRMALAFTVSDTGLLAYQAGSVFRSRLAWFDRRTGAQTSTLGELADYADVMLSPDGKRAAVSVMDSAIGTRDLWIFDLARGIRERLTSDSGDDFAPIWSRQDGRHLAFSSWRAGSVHLYKVPAGGGTPALLWEDSLGKYASDWSADGKFLVYVAGGGIISRSDLWVLPVGGGKAAPILETAFIESHGQLSPDGRWLAYMSTEAGLRGPMEVYVMPFPGPGERRQVSTAGGGWPRWRRDGREIFYLARDNTLMAVTVNGQGARFEISGERPLFKVRPRPFARLDAFPYDVTANGQRFIVNTMVDEPTAAPITLVVNWGGILRR